MEPAFARERIRAAAEGARQPPEGRPDRGRRRRERFLSFDVATDVEQPALESLQERAEHAEGVFRRDERGGQHARDGGLRLADAARGTRLCDRRQPLDGSGLGGIERGALAEVLDDVLEGLNLRGQLAGRRPIVAVLGFKRVLGGAEPIDLRKCAPPRAQADQHGHREHADDEAGGETHTDRHPADDAGGAIGDENRVTSCEHTPV